MGSACYRRPGLPRNMAQTRTNEKRDCVGSVTVKAADSELKLRSWRGQALPASLQHAQQLAVHGLVAGDDVAAGEHGVAAVEIGDEAAGLAHQDDAGRHVPGREAALPVGVEAAGRDPGEIERGRAEAAQARDLVLHGGRSRGGRARDRRGRVRQPAGDDRVGEPLARGDAQAPVVEEGALAALGGEQLVVGRIVDQAGDDRALALERDRDREVRDAVQEVGGAVERIDDPGVGLVGAFARAAFLAEEAVARARLASAPRAGSPRRGGRRRRRSWPGP